MVTAYTQVIHISRDPRFNSDKQPKKVWLFVLFFLPLSGETQVRLWVLHVAPPQLKGHSQGSCEYALAWPGF